MYIWGDGSRLADLTTGDSSCEVLLLSDSPRAMRQEVENCVAEGMLLRVFLSEWQQFRGEILLTTKQLFAARPKVVV